MGCDIHIYVEKKIGDTWFPIAPPEHNSYYEPGDEQEGGPYNRPLLLNHDTYDVGRNYRVFAMLAGVRNGIGFASVKTGEPITPISKPRGLPQDVSVEVREISNDWGPDGHSHSWLTLAELDTVPWKSNKVHLSGFVDAREFRTFEEMGEPDNWSYPLSRQGFTEVSADELRALAIEHGIEEPKNPWSPARINGVLYLTEVHWTRTWAEIASELLASMEKLRVAGTAEGFTPDQLRYVFWFDN
jgi:hypothetical protein